MNYNHLADIGGIIFLCSLWVIFAVEIARGIKNLITKTLIWTTCAGACLLTSAVILRKSKMEILVEVRELENKKTQLFIRKAELTIKQMEKDLQTDTTEESIN